jgi:hypothetical protein
MPLTTRKPRSEWIDHVPRVGDDPNDPVEVMRDAWRRGDGPGVEPGLFDLGAGVGSDERNRRRDVARMEVALAHTGDHDIDRTQGPTGFFGNEHARSIRRFQERNGLRSDGLIRPGGPTMRRLRNQLVSADPTRDTGTAAPPSRKHAGSEKETQVAIAPLLAIPAIAAGWSEIAGIAALAGKALLGGAALAIISSLRSDTPEGGASPAEGDADARHRQALLTRGTEVFLMPFQPGYQNSRGDADTQRGNSIIVEECNKILLEEFPKLEGRVKHAGGATEDGEGKVKVKVKETYIPNRYNPDNPRLGSTRPDITYTFDGNDKERININTASMLADGTTTTLPERKQLEKLSRLSQRVVTAMRKLRPGETDTEYAEEARKVCREILQDAKDLYDREDTDDE